MNTTDQFEYAKRIATTATVLDSEKNDFPDEAREIAKDCVDDLHRLAKKLAGNHVHDIYI